MAKPNRPNPRQSPLKSAVADPAFQRAVRSEAFKTLAQKCKREVLEYLLTRWLEARTWDDPSRLRTGTRLKTRLAHIDQAAEDLVFLASVPAIHAAHHKGLAEGKVTGGLPLSELARLLKHAVAEVRAAKPLAIQRQRPTVTSARALLTAYVERKWNQPMDAEVAKLVGCPGDTPAKRAVRQKLWRHRHETEIEGQRSMAGGFE